MDIENDFENRYLHSEYGKLHYVLHRGVGPAVIFLHGFAGSLRSWTRLVQHIPDSLAVYALDLLGHGDSEAPEADYSLGMHYETVRELVEEQDLERYCLFGHSYGGWIAAHYAIRENVSGLILEDSAGLKEFSEERYRGDPNYAEGLVRRALSLNPREGVLRKMLSADNTDDLLTPNSLGNIESKTLIIWGGNDTTVDIKYAKIFNRAIRGSRLAVLDGERHTPHYTSPEAVSKLLVGFIGEVL